MGIAFAVNVTILVGLLKFDYAIGLLHSNDILRHTYSLTNRYSAPQSAIIITSANEDK